MNTQLQNLIAQRADLDAQIAAAKYRHRVTGATWTGRGKRPKGFAAAEQSELEHLGGDLA